jgi:hypothetical protein
MRNFKSFGLLVFAAMAMATNARATVVDISAGPNGWGCTSCFGGPASLGSAPGDVVTLVNTGESGPLQVTLAAGTYNITNASPLTGNFSAWRFDSGNDWAWNFAIGSDNGNGTATVVEVGSVNATSATQAGMANLTNVQTFHFGTLIDQNGSTAGFHDTLTLAATTTLDFFIIDGFLTDNAGGVALDLELAGQTNSTPLPSALPLFASGLGFVGYMARRRRNTRSALAT